MSPASRGSGTRRAREHRPHRARRRRRVVAIGPTVSKLGQSGKTPSTGIRPQLGLRPTTPQHDGRQADRAAGVGADAEVAEARGERRRVAARRAAGRAARDARGFCTVPYHGFWLVTPQANSCRFALPTTTAPAATSRCDRGRRARRHVVGVDLRAVGRADAGGVDQVLDERAACRAAGPAAPRRGSTSVMTALHGRRSRDAARPPRPRASRPGSRARSPRRACSRAASRRRPPAAPG